MRISDCSSDVCSSDLSRFMASAPALIDRHGRTISYLRLSVTDRCDLRCRYCMAERMTFLPRDRLLSLEEIAIIAERFTARGVTKIRLTGGEPLVRRVVTDLAHRLGRPPAGRTPGRGKVVLHVETFGAAEP